MGYFRNFYYLLGFISRLERFFKKHKKLLFIIIISLIVYFGLHSYGFCADYDIQLQQISNELSTISANTNNSVVYLRQLGVDVSDIESQLTLVNNKLENLSANVDSLEEEVSSIITILNNATVNIVNRLNSINNDINNNNQTLINELQTQSNSIITELQALRDALNGSGKQPASFTDNGLRNSNTSNFKMRLYTINYEQGYSYTIKLYINNTFTTKSVNLRVYASNNFLPSNFDVNVYGSQMTTISTIPASSNNYVVTYEVPSSHPAYIYFGGYDSYNITRVEITKEIKGLSDTLNQNNDLQQQQNNLQQQQNEFLQNSDINVDNNLPSNDTQDITASGFDNIFMTLYNTFTSSSSQSLTFTVPFTGKSFVISKQTLFGSANLGILSILINAFWYYLVSLYIVKDISKKINKIKSGNIEGIQNNNIKEDLL